MDTMSSVEFRKRYARLTAPVIVTVSGHAIGTWLPFRSTVPITITGSNGEDRIDIGEPEEIDVTDPRQPVPVVHDYAPRTFTPAPKPSAKRR